MHHSGGLSVKSDDAVLTVTLRRPHKRNAIDDPTVLALEHVFNTLDGGVRAVVLNAEGEHFCAGLDLNEMSERDAFSGVQHSRMWHRALATIENSPVPVVAALTGAVVGGGLELAAACHIRVADRTTFYALPEGQRGIFVGGGASVRIPRLIGTARMIDMMLTGRRLDADEGYAAGLSQYVVPVGEAGTTARQLAERAATVAPQTVFAVLHALPRIAAANPAEGYLLESLMSGVAQSTDDAKHRMSEFLSGRAGKVTD